MLEQRTSSPRHCPKQWERRRRGMIRRAFEARAVRDQVRRWGLAFEASPKAAETLQARSFPVPSLLQAAGSTVTQVVATAGRPFVSSLRSTTARSRISASTDPRSNRWSMAAI
jgi:hypothetical protein